MVLFWMGKFDARALWRNDRKDQRPGSAGQVGQRSTLEAPGGPLGLIGAINKRMVHRYQAQVLKGGEGSCRHFSL